VDNNADNSGTCTIELNANYSSVLPHLTVSNAARDLERVISWVKANSTTPDVVIFASEYGSFLTNRLLTLFPNVVSAVVMQSVMAGPNRMSELDANMNLTAQLYSQGCDADPVCRSYLGVPSFNKFISVFTKFTTSDCTKFAGVFGFTADKVRPILGAAVLEPLPRSGLFPLLYRLDRCSADDQNRIFTAINDLSTSAPFTVGPTPNPSSIRLAFSKSLSNHITLSELLFAPGANVSKSTLDASSDTVPVALYQPGKLAQTYSSWTLRYQQDSYATQYPTTTVPVLLLNGQVDGITGISWARRARTSGYTANNQRLIEIPEAGHNVLGNSPTNNSAIPCGLQIVGSFLSQTTFDVNAVNASCLNFITLTDFASARNSTRDYAFRLFGTYDVWGVSSPPTAILSPVVRGAPSKPAAPTASSVASVVVSSVLAALVGISALLLAL
jgi:pimeloyl-ACP methyl ester carboxylesterase